MAEEEKYYYEKMHEDGKMKWCPANDFDGSITGHIVFGLKAWFDENPEERKRLGWIKHITQDTKKIEYNRKIQYLAKSVVRVDEWTVKDEYHVMDKTEEIYLLEDLLACTGDGDLGALINGGEWDEWN